MLEKYLRGLHWFFHLLVVVLILTAGWLSLVHLPPRILPTAQIHNTQKWGVIWRNERWSGEVRIVGDLWALPGTTVVIDPGTRVLVESSGDKFNLHWSPWGLKSGLNSGQDEFGVKNGELYWDESQKIQLRLAKVFAIGTPQLPVVVKSTSTPGSPYDFNLISIESGVISYAKLSNYRKLLAGNQLTLRDSRVTQVVECGVCVEYNSPTIINNIFESALRQHIFIIGGSPKINDNLFLTANCSERCSDPTTPGVAILVDPQGYGAPQILHNDFEMGAKTGVEIISGSEEEGVVGLIASNDFLGSSLIEIPCDSKVRIVDNRLRGGVKLKHSGNCVGSLTIEQNYWWLPDVESVLDQRILEKEPQFKVKIVDILSQPPDSGRRI